MQRRTMTQTFNHIPEEFRKMMNKRKNRKLLNDWNDLFHFKTQYRPLRPKSIRISRLCTQVKIRRKLYYATLKHSIQTLQMQLQSTHSGILTEKKNSKFLFIPKR